MGRQTFYPPFFLPFSKSQTITRSDYHRFWCRRKKPEKEEGRKTTTTKDISKQKKSSRKDKQRQTREKILSLLSSLSLLSLACPMFVQCRSYKRATHQKEAAIKLDCCTTHRTKNKHTHTHTTQANNTQSSWAIQFTATTKCSNRSNRKPSSSFSFKSIQSTTQLMDRTDSAVPN